MNTKITLTNPTNDKLDAAVARYVVGQYSTRQDWDRLMELHQTTIPMFLPYATSADAVLPLLAAHTKRTNELRGGEGDTWKIHAPAGDDDDWSVCPIWMHHDGWVEEIGMMGEAPTFPRAACIALLRANGVEVVT